MFESQHFLLCFFQNIKDCFRNIHRISFWMEYKIWIIKDDQNIKKNQYSKRSSFFAWWLRWTIIETKVVILTTKGLRKFPWNNYNIVDIIQY